MPVLAFRGKTTKNMSKEMLEAFRVLEEEKHINKEDIIDAVVEFNLISLQASLWSV